MVHVYALTRMEFCSPTCRRGVVQRDLFLRQAVLGEAHDRVQRMHHVGPPLLRQDPKVQCTRSIRLSEVPRRQAGHPAVEPPAGTQEAV